MPSTCRIGSISTTLSPASTHNLDSLDIAALVILALALRASKDFLGGQIADSFQKTSLAELAADTFIDAVLNCINVLVAGDFSLGEFVYENQKVADTM